MTDKKLSQLTTGAPVAATDLFYSAQDIGGGAFNQVKQPASALSAFMSGVPGGSSPQVQYNNSGVFGGAANLTILSGNPNVSAGNAYMYDGSNVIRAQVSINNFWEGGSGNLTATGGNNMGTGPAALAAVTSGSGNTCVGVSAGTSITSGLSNIAMGANALHDNTIGQDNIAMGAGAMQRGTGSCNSNVAIGAFSLWGNGTFSQNVAIGVSALGVNLGNNNMAIGVNALSANTFGTDNVAVGFSALAGNSTGGSNVAIGDSALGHCNGDSNIGIGFNAGLNITTGGGNVIIGGQTNITSGVRNVGIGFWATFPSATANEQISIQALINATGASGSGAGLVGIGTAAPVCKLDVSGSIKTEAVVVASLPAPGNMGARDFVTDSNATLVAGLGNIVAGAGANKVPVYDDGTNWRIG